MLSAPLVPEMMIDASSMTVTWPRWNAGMDIGDPPIGGYRLEYQQKGQTVWLVSHSAIQKMTLSHSNFKFKMNSKMNLVFHIKTFLTIDMDIS